MKILIVEDNTQKLRTVQEILEQNFIDYYEVAGCGRDAYQIARDFPHFFAFLLYEADMPISLQPQ